jgi:hypothetical protein
VTWWSWTLIWVLLLLGAAVVFFLIGRSLWRKAKVLLTELSTAAERLGAVSDGLAELADSPVEAAVFTDPSQLRQERFLAARGQGGKLDANPSVTRRDPGTQKPRQSVR